MVRETSVEAYRAIVDNGMLSRRRLQVYEILYQNGPLAGAQVAYLFAQRHGKTSRSETVRNRITELRDLGVVKEVGWTVDPNTKMRVIQWDVTSKLPGAEKKKPSKRKAVVALVEAADYALAELRRMGSTYVDVNHRAYERLFAAVRAVKEAS